MWTALRFMRHVDSAKPHEVPHLLSVTLSRLRAEHDAKNAAKHDAKNAAKHNAKNAAKHDAKNAAKHNAKNAAEHDAG